MPEFGPGAGRLGGEPAYQAVASSASVGNKEGGAERSSPTAQQALKELLFQAVSGLLELAGVLFGTTHGLADATVVAVAAKPPARNP